MHVALLHYNVNLANKDFLWCVSQFQMLFFTKHDGVPNAVILLIAMKIPQPLMVLVENL